MSSKAEQLNNKVTSLADRWTPAMTAEYTKSFPDAYKTKKGRISKALMNLHSLALKKIPEELLDHGIIALLGMINGAIAISGMGKKRVSKPMSDETKEKLRARAPKADPAGVLKKAQKALDRTQKKLNAQKDRVKALGGSEPEPAPAAPAAPVPTMSIQPVGPRSPRGSK